MRGWGFGAPDFDLEPNNIAGAALLRKVSCALDKFERLLVNLNLERIRRDVQEAHGLLEDFCDMIEESDSWFTFTHLIRQHIPPPPYFSSPSSIVHPSPPC
eukprot:7103562-Pyramimonas_sp.AAC.1